MSSLSLTISTMLSSPALHVRHRGVVVGRALPGAVEVVAHDVDGVQVGRDGGHVQPLPDLGPEGRDGRGQLEAAGVQVGVELPHLQKSIVKSSVSVPGSVVKLTAVTHPRGEVGLVLRRRKLKVEVEAVEAVLLQHGPRRPWE